MGYNLTNFTYRNYCLGFVFVDCLRIRHQQPPFIDSVFFFFGGGGSIFLRELFFIERVICVSVELILIEGGFLLNWGWYDMHFKNAVSKKTWKSKKRPLKPNSLPWNCWWNNSLLNFHGAFQTRLFIEWSFPWTPEGNRTPVWHPNHHQRRRPFAPRW